MKHDAIPQIHLKLKLVRHLSSEAAYLSRQLGGLVSGSEGAGKKAGLLGALDLQGFLQLHLQFRDALGQHGRLPLLHLLHVVHLIRHLDDSRPHIRQLLLAKYPPVESGGITYEYFRIVASVDGRFQIRAPAELSKVRHCSSTGPWAQADGRQDVRHEATPALRRWTALWTRWRGRG